jgi:hypothetical protein
LGELWLPSFLLKLLLSTLRYCNNKVMRKGKGIGMAQEQQTQGCDEGFARLVAFQEASAREIGHGRYYVHKTNHSAISADDGNALFRFYPCKTN